MPATGKVKPEVRDGGVFLPWKFVGWIVLSLLVPGVFSFIVFAFKAYTVADKVEAVVVNDKKQDGEIVVIRERLAKQEAKP